MMKKFKVGRPEVPFRQDPARRLVPLLNALVGPGGFPSVKQAARQIASERDGNFLYEKILSGDRVGTVFGPSNSPTAADGREPSNTRGKAVPATIEYSADSLRRKKRIAERDPANREWIALMTAAIKVMLNYEGSGPLAPIPAVRVGNKAFLEISHRRLVSLLLTEAGEDPNLLEPHFEEIEQAWKVGRELYYRRTP